MVTWFGAQSTEATRQLIRAIIEVHVGEISEARVTIARARHLVGDESIAFKASGQTADGDEFNVESSVAWRDL